MRKKNIVIIGAGPGIGNYVAKKFGDNDFRVFLISRNQCSLDKYIQELGIEGIEVYAFVADASNTESITNALNRIMEIYGAVDVLVYNAAMLQAGFPTSLNSEMLMKHYQVDVASALHSVLQTLPKQLEQSEGTIIFTGGGYALYPVPEYTAVSAGKAALRALTFALAEELKDKGIFAGVVTIMGNVAPGTHFAPELIAEKYWEMYVTRKEHEIIYN